MQSIEGELQMPDGQDVESLPLQVIDQHHFRLLEQPLWLPLRWGDLIRAQPEDNQDNSWFVESVIARAPHRYLKGGIDRAQTSPRLVA